MDFLRRGLIFESLEAADAKATAQWAIPYARWHPSRLATSDKRTSSYDQIVGSH